MFNQRALLFLTFLFGFLLPVVGEGCWATTRFLPDWLNVFFLLFSSFSIYFLLIAFPILCLAWYWIGAESSRGKYLMGFLWGILFLLFLGSALLAPIVLSYNQA